MVYARAAKDNAHAVYEKSVASPRKGADTDLFAHRVCTEAHAQSVEIRRLGIPELSVGNLERENALLALDGGDALLTVEKLNGDLASAAGLYGYLDLRGVDGESSELHAVLLDVLPVRAPEPHGAVDAGAGVPAGVRLIGVAALDGYLVFAVNGAVERNVEIRVAVGALRDLLAVQKYLGAAVHALKFEIIDFTCIKSELL